MSFQNSIYGGNADRIYICEDIIIIYDCTSELPQPDGIVGYDNVANVLFLLMVKYFCSVSSARLLCGSIECTNRLAFTFTILLFIKNALHTGKPKK